MLTWVADMGGCCVLTSCCEVFRTLHRCSQYYKAVHLRVLAESFHNVADRVTDPCGLQSMQENATLLELSISPQARAHGC